MTRDYSKFFSDAPSTPRILNPLEALGWQPFFSQQIDIDTMQTTPPVRVIEVHRSGLQVRGDGVKTGFCTTRTCRKTASCWIAKA